MGLVVERLWDGQTVEEVEILYSHLIRLSFPPFFTDVAELLAIMELYNKKINFNCSINWFSIYGVITIIYTYEDRSLVHRLVQQESHDCSGTIVDHMINKYSLPKHTTPMKVQTKFSIIEIGIVSDMLLHNVSPACGLVI